MSQDRFNELKEKGWRNLDANERGEFQELKKQFEGPTIESVSSVSQASLPAQPTEERTITVSESQLKSMVQAEVMKHQNTAQQSIVPVFVDGKWKRSEPPKIGNRNATFRRFREDSDSPVGIIVNWRFHKNVFNQETQKTDKPIYKITVLYDDASTKEFEIEWLEFAKITDIETVEIVEMKKEKEEMSQGRIRLPMWKGNERWIGLDKETQARYMTDKMKDLVVFRDRITVTVKRPNGQLYTCNADRLNA